MIVVCESCKSLNRVDAARAADAKCGSCHAALRADGHPVAVSDDELATLVQKSPVPVLVDFWATWCPPCRTLGPILEELGRRHAGALIIAKVDTDRHGRTAGELGVSGIPAVFLYKGGQVVAQATGLRPLPAWEQLVGPHLG